jgi:hypothetical protein
MTKTATQKAEMKQEAKHEGKELLLITAYLAFFFCALATYTTLLLKQYDVPFWNYAFALINSLVIAKVILIGQVVHLGEKYEHKPLLLSALYKAFMYCLFALAFHFVEELIKRLIHGANLAEASRTIRIDQLLGHTLVVFCTFIPLFAFMEFRRVLGEETFYNLLFRSEAAGRSQLSANK